MFTTTEDTPCVLVLHLESDTGREVNLSLPYFHCSMTTAILVLQITKMSKEMLMLITLHLLTQNSC